MRLTDLLFEGPYELGRNAPNISTKEYPSLEGLKRENFALGTLDRYGETFHFWLSTSHGTAKVTTPHKDDIGQDRQQTVVNISFQRMSFELPMNKPLQVHKVFTDSDYRNRWLAGALYIVLARYGFSVVSDYHQYNGGVALWKKLATESEARKYVVRVWSDETEDWVKDNDGNPIQYNAANLQHDTIWNSLAKMNESTTLLVLSHQ